MVVTWFKTLFGIDIPQISDIKISINKPRITRVRLLKVSF